MPSPPSRQRLLYGLALALLVVTAGVFSVSSAERRALTAEEEYLTDRLENASCLADWGTNEGAGPSRDASVLDPSAVGVRVSVTVPYAYRTEVDNQTVYADSASEAVYEVGLTDVRRVRGDDVSPC